MRSVTSSVTEASSTIFKKSSHRQRVVRTGQSTVHNIVRVIDMPSQSKYEKQKLSQNHLSSLMKCILSNADGGIQRGEITEKFYGLERRYSGCYSDPCLRGKQKSDYERQYRRAQPAISKALRKLENRSLVRLIRHGKYVKGVWLTEKGMLVAQKLRQAAEIRVSISKDENIDRSRLTRYPEYSRITCNKWKEHGFTELDVHKIKLI